MALLLSLLLMMLLLLLVLRADSADPSMWATENCTLRHPSIATPSIEAYLRAIDRIEPPQVDIPRGGQGRLARDAALPMPDHHMS